ncbi:MAG: hypothetical protein NT154_39625, partial [Verrucomicrobia bacterium]|nr:hypothetical protein [Verrucomicrobiota bacterium]
MAFLTNGLFPWVVGGMQKHSANLIREWARMGVDLDVYFSEGPGYPPPQEGSLQASRLGMASGMVSSPQPSPPEEERG